MKYQKIPGPFKREVTGPNKNKIIEGDWTSPELAALQDIAWVWTEKVDGTNIRIMWDGHKVTYGGRTDNAQIPTKLLPALDEMFTEEIFEQQFSGTPVTLFGEGYGAGIQSGGVYRPDQSFVLFDVHIGDYWLKRVDAEQVAGQMGINIVPKIFVGSIDEAIWSIKRGFVSRWNENHYAEGLVGVTECGLLDRSGERIMVKIKRKDFVS